MRDRFQWARMLAFVAGLVNQELLLRNEYLAAENRILRAHLPARLWLSDAERVSVAGWRPSGWLAAHPHEAPVFRVVCGSRGAIQPIVAERLRNS